MAAVTRPQPRPCPICGQPATEESRPFCSRRCADIDLSNWFTGKYAIPVVEADEPEKDGGEGEKD